MTDKNDRICNQDELINILIKNEPGCDEEEARGISEDFIRMVLED